MRPPSPLPRHAPLIAALAGAVLVGACAGATRRPAAATGSRESHGSFSASVAAGTVSAGAASARAAGSPSGAAAPSASAPADATRFFLFAEGAPPLVVHTGARTTISAGGGALFEVLGDDVRPVASPPSPIQPGSPFVVLSSAPIAWPRWVVTVISDPTARAGTGCLDVAFHDGSAANLADVCEPMLAATDGALALLGVAPHPPGTPDVLHVYTAGDPIASARLPMGDDPDACPGRMAHASALHVTRQGTVVLAGTECGTARTVVERASPGDADAMVDRLPDAPSCASPPSIAEIASRGDDDVWIAGGACERGYVARFDGRAWSLVAAALPRPVKSFAVARDGAWALDDRGALWELPAQGDPRPVPRVDGATAVRAFGADVWVEAGGRVYRNRAPANVAKLATQPSAPFGRWPSCAALFVQIAIVSESAPPTYDFPLTRKALAGHTELAGARFVVTSERAFGAIVPDPKTGERLADVLRAGLAGSAPQLMCGAPNVTRTVDFDLATGAMRP